MSNNYYVKQPFIGIVHWFDITEVYPQLYSTTAHLTDALINAMVATWPGLEIPEKDAKTIAETMHDATFYAWLKFEEFSFADWESENAAYVDPDSEVDPDYLDEYDLTMYGDTWRLEDYNKVLNKIITDLRDVYLAKKE